MSWSTDECASFYENRNFTMQWCVISESLRNSVHDKGAHGYGGIWGGLKASFHHNLIAHHDSRNPRLGEYAARTVPLEGLLDIRNNVIYNWGGNSCYGGDAMNVNLVNNYWKPGPGTSNSTKERILSTGRNLDPTHPLCGIWGKFFVDGNFVNGSTRATQDNWTYGVYNQFHGSQLPVSDADKLAMRINAPHAPGEITTHSATKAYELVLDYVGASLYRDAVDKRAVDDTRSGGATIMNGGNGSTNGYIDTPAAAGGWPVLPTADAPVDTDGDGMPDSWETSNSLNPNNPIVTSPTTYTISYLNLPKLVINPNAKTVTIGTAYQLLEPQCRGYRFMGWYSDAAYSDEITGFSTAQSQNTSVYARWKKLEAFYAYPSVAKHSVTLKSSVENDTVNIVSVTGVVVKQVNTSSLEREISVSDLPAGYYMIQSAKSGLTTKIIIK